MDEPTSNPSAFISLSGLVSKHLPDEGVPIETNLLQVFSELISNHSNDFYRPDLSLFPKSTSLLSQ